MKYIGIKMDKDTESMNQEFLQSLDYIVDDDKVGEMICGTEVTTFDHVLSQPEEKFFFILSDNFRGETQSNLKSLGFTEEKDFVPVYDWYGDDKIPTPFTVGTWDEYQKTWNYNGEKYAARKKVMCSMLDFKKIKSIADMGCGVMGLKELLPENAQYIPVDYIKRDDSTVLCDFNQHQFPDIAGICSGRVDNIFLSGVLRYIIDWRWFLKECRENSNSVILTYFVGGHNINQLQSEWRRRGYRHTAPIMEVVSEFLNDGWKLKDHMVFRRVTQILYFERE